MDACHPQTRTLEQKYIKQQPAWRHSKVVLLYSKKKEGNENRDKVPKAVTGN